MSCKTGKSISGIYSGYVAEIIDECSTPAEYDTPIALGGIISTGATPNTISTDKASDNIVNIDEELLTSITLNLVLQDITDEMLAYISNRKIDSITGSVITNVNDIAKKFAFGYKLTYNDETEKFVWLLNCKFNNIHPIDGTSRTKGGITYTDVAVTVNCLPLSNGDIKNVIRSDSSYFTQNIGDTWFNAVKVPGEIREEVTLNTNVAVTGVVIDSNSITLNNVVTEAIVEATVLPLNAQNKDVIWESDNESVATVVGNGLSATITAESIGNCTISVSTVEGNFIANTVVNVL